MNDLTPEQKLKGVMIFKYLKTGKMPKRKGLFRILFYLAGEHKNFGSILMTSSSTTKKRPNFDRTIEIKIGLETNRKKLEDIFKKYLVDFEVQYDSYLNTYLNIYYSSNQIKWALIDQELRTNHAENIFEKDGFPRIKNYQYEKK